MTGLTSSTESKRNFDVVLYDGPCNLCNRSVQWVIANDTKLQFRFASLQSEIAKQLLADEVIKAGSLPDSIALVDPSGQVCFRSDAIIGICRKLGFPWSVMVVGKCLPRFVRDAFYSWFAKNRYRWFGKSDQCQLPTDEIRSRFLDI